MTAPVYCDPALPKDWKEREERLQLERAMEIAFTRPQDLEPQILDAFRQAAML